MKLTPTQHRWLQWLIERGGSGIVDSYGRVHAMGENSLVWEAENGSIPDGHIVVFRPGQKTIVVDEVTIDKLEMISRVENMRRNTLHRYPKEIALAIQAVGALNRQINKRMKANEK